MMNKKLNVNFGKYGNRYAIKLDDDQIVYQVHRDRGGISFQANATAMIYLSEAAYRLYMFMIMKPMYQVNHLIRSQVERATRLTEAQINVCLEELKAKGYLQPGDVHIGEQVYKHNAYQLREYPCASDQHMVCFSIICPCGQGGGKICLLRVKKEADPG